jgi:hypothetical protein
MYHFLEAGLGAKAKQAGRMLVYDYGCCIILGAVIEQATTNFVYIDTYKIDT